MTCAGTGSCKQGRQPARCDCGGLVTENSDGSDPHGGYIKDLFASVLLVVVAAIVGWILVGVVR